MLTKEENELLCRVEGDAPMGQLMRRHWTPVCLVEEVSEPDGAPVKARVFGEDLVVFRDSDGRVGVLDEYCPHRARVAVLRPQRGGRAALPVSRLEDGRRGQRARDGLRARRQRHGAEGQAQGLSDAGVGRHGLGVHGPRRTMPDVPAAGVGADARTRASASPRCWCRATGRRCSKARSTRRTARACIRPTWCRRASSARGAPTRPGCGLRPTRRRACRCSARGYGFRYAALRRPITERAPRTTTCARPCSSRRRRR